MNDFVLPLFEKHKTGLIIRHRTLKTTGIAESFLAEQIGDVHKIFSPDSNITLAFLPSSLGVRLRITAKAKSVDEAENKIQDVETKLRSKINKYIYSADEKELEDTIGELLSERKLTISIAESCTGGLIADRITNVSGSSNYFERGIITYSNKSKMHELGVPQELINRHGAVSREVAETMALGVRTKSIRILEFPLQVLPARLEVHMKNLSDLSGLDIPIKMKHLQCNLILAANEGL